MRIFSVAVVWMTFYTVFAQEIVATDKFVLPNELPPVYVQQIAGDSLSTSFLIVVSDTVQLHKHLFHSEHIFVLAGEAMLYFNDNITKIHPNDFLFIPKETWHAVKVTSSEPLRVISIQSPGFDGTDRVLKN